jgi:3-oxoacyl-[acyl-carrier-protein] synthase II
LNLCGPMVTFSTACAAGGNAIGYAISEIQNDRADAMVAGGAEATITPLGLAAFCSGRLLSINRDPDSACCPFDKRRDGLIMAEGGAFVVLESMENAIKRKATIFAEIIGYASVSTAYDMTRPLDSGDSFKRAMIKSLLDADLKAGDISYINAHGVSAPLTDLCEAKAIMEIFNGRSPQIPVSSIKSMIGQPFAASCPMQIISSALTIERQIIPPTIHFEVPDPDIDLQIVANHALGRGEINTVMVNSFGYGGTNVTLLLKKISAMNDRRVRYAPFQIGNRRKGERRHRPRKGSGPI